MMTVASANTVHVDKPKFGGAGRLKQSCVDKKCQKMQTKADTSSVNIM